MRYTFTALCLFMITIGYSQDSLQNYNLDSVVITGLRADNKTPISQKIITCYDIDVSYQGEEIPIILDKTPSITSSSDGGHNQGYTYFWLRGIDQTRINITLDGIPLNEPEDQGVYTSNYPGFINGIKSLQIQRGVGTSSNGVSSFGGSINFESESGIQRKVEVQIGAGSYETFRTTLTYASGLTKKKFAFFGTGSAYTSNGYRDHSGGFGTSLFLSGGYYGDKDIVKVTAFTGLSKNNMSYFGTDEETIKVNRRTNFNDKNDVDKFNQTLIKAQYSRVIDENLTLTSSIFYNRLDGNYFFSFPNYNVALSSNFYGIVSNLNYTKNKLQLNVGLNANTYNRKHTGAGYNPDSSLIDYRNIGYKSEVSGFVKIAYSFTSKLMLYTDVQFRYTNFTFKNAGQTLLKRNYSFLNPKFGLNYTINDKLNSYLSVGLSQREPTRSNLFEGLDELVVNPLTKPELVVDVELGLNYKRNNLNLQTNFYFMDFHNGIIPNGEIGANTLLKMVNVEKSFRTGIEIDLNYQVNKYFSFGNTFNASYNQFTYEGKKELLYSPSCVFNQYIKAEYKGAMLMVSGKAQSKSYVDFDNKYALPIFFIMNVDASYNYQILTVLLQVNNITNAKYYTNGYMFLGTPYYIVNAGPNVNLTLKLTF